jgi:hypothetical protein
MLKNETIEKLCSRKEEEEQYRELYRNELKGKQAEKKLETKRA